MVVRWVWCKYVTPCTLLRVLRYWRYYIIFCNHLTTDIVRLVRTNQEYIIWWYLIFVFIDGHAAIDSLRWRLMACQQKHNSARARWTLQSARFAARHCSAQDVKVQWRENRDFYGLCGDLCGDSLSKWWGQLTKWTTCWWATKTGRHEYQCNRWIDCEHMFQVIWRHCKDMQGLNSGIFWLQLVLQILSWI